MTEKVNASLIGLAADESTPSLLDIPESPAQAETSATPEAAQADVGTGAAVPAEPASVSEPYLFGGREWKDQAEAEQSWKSWEGRIQAEQGRNKELSQNLQNYWDYVQAVSKENEEFRTQLGKAQPAPEVKAEEKEKEGGIDFDQIGRLMSMARTQGLDPMTVGIRAYAAQAEKMVEAKIADRVASLEQHVEQTQEANLVQNADKEMFVWAQGLKYDTGQPAYPELQKEGLNQEFVSNVYRTWKKLGEEFGVKYAYSLAGFDYAYRLSREIAAAAAPPAARDERGRFTASNEAARAASDITGTQPNPTKRVAKTETQLMLEELDAVKPVKFGTTDLGFFA